MTNGRFQPGRSANPTGRPKGSIGPKRMVDLHVRPHLQNLIEQTVCAALKGDAQAATALVKLYAATRSK